MLDLENQTNEDKIEASRTKSPVTLSPAVVEEITGKTPNGSASPRGTCAHMVAVDEEIIEKAPDGTTSPGGTWAEMVNHNRINSKSSTPVQSSS